VNVDLKRLQAGSENFAAELALLLNRQQANNPDVDQVVAEILAQVARAGDKALHYYTHKFDGFDAEARGLEVRPARLDQALQEIDIRTRESLEFAVQRVRDYHQHQLQDSWQYQEADGTSLGQKVTPLKRVGLYVPGGRRRTYYGYAYARRRV